MKMTMTDKQQETTFDFGDGKGPVPAKKHPNGGGWVAQTARVDPKAFVAPMAAVGGNAYVAAGAKIEDAARIYGDARIHENTRISQHARVFGEAEVFGDMCISGDDVVSRTPLLVQGDLPTITITDHTINAACRRLSPSEWADHGAALMRTSGRFTRQQVREWPGMIAVLAKGHGCTDA